MSDVFLKTYNRLPVKFTKGDGSWLYDDNNKKYLDFASGIAVNCLGHNYPALVKAIQEQSAKLLHTCNYYLSDTSVSFAQKLVEACSNGGMKKVFLANSGAEANEGACKIVRKYSLGKYGSGRHTIVTLKGSFHGRTITTLSATGQDNFHKDFGPFTEGFVYVQPNDIEALDKALDPDTSAGLLLEVIQGESGIRLLSDEYLKAAAKFCAERDILLMLDEIQTGVGRTGTFLACEAYGIKPDIVTLAKGLCGGIPAGAVLAGEKAADVFKIGDHGSTFGGNVLAAAAGLVVLDKVNNPVFLKEIKAKGDLFIDIIKSWNHPRIKEIRGRGLMTGIDIDTDSWPIIEKGISSAQTGTGLLVLGGGKQTLRLLPPYIIKEEEIKQGLEILKSLL